MTKRTTCIVGTFLWKLTSPGGTKVTTPPWGLASAALAAAGLVLLGCQSAIRSTAPPESTGRATGAGRAQGPIVYVSNEESNDIAVIDGSTDTLVTTIFVGKRPRGIKLSPDGKNLFVALSGSPMAPPGVDESKLPPPDRAADGIAIVDVASRQVIRTLSTGEDPESFDISSDGRTLYVSNEDAATATVVDLSSGAIKKVISVGGEPEGVRIHPDGKVVYMTSEADNEVDVIDIASQTVIAKVETSLRPRAVAFTPDGASAYVTAEQGAAVTVVDARRHAALGQIPIEVKGAKPMGIAMSNDGKTAYVTCGRGTAIVIIDTATNRVVKTVLGVGTRPWGIALAPDGRKLYTANGPSNDVSVVDVASGTVVKKIPAGRGPWGVAISP
jgi:YVTN family beta-propeller protein